MEKTEGQVHRILLADDDPLVLQLLSSVLTNAGHSVQTCPDGEAASREISTGKYTLLVTDDDMPGMTGSQLTLQLRSRGVRIPIILISARKILPESAFTNRGDGFAFLKKPFAFGKLHDAIREVSSSSIQP